MRIRVFIKHTHTHWNFSVIRKMRKPYAKIRKSLSERLVFLEEAFQAKSQNIISSSKWLKAEMRCIEWFGMNLHVLIGISIKRILLRGSTGRIAKHSNNGIRLPEVKFSFPDLSYLTLGKWFYLCAPQQCTYHAEDFKDQICKYM